MGKGVATVIRTTIEGGAKIIHSPSRGLFVNGKHEAAVLGSVVETHEEDEEARDSVSHLDARGNIKRPRNHVSPHMRGASKNFFVGGRGVVRDEDYASCGHKVEDGVSNNFFVN